MPLLQKVFFIIQICSENLICFFDIAFEVSDYEVSNERPQLRFLPSDADQVFHAGDTFELVCEADFSLEWRLPSILDTRDYVSQYY